MNLTILNNVPSIGLAEDGENSELKLVIMDNEPSVSSSQLIVSENEPAINLAEGSDSLVLEFMSFFQGDKGKDGESVGDASLKYSAIDW